MSASPMAPGGSPPVASILAIRFHPANIRSKLEDFSDCILWHRTILQIEQPRLAVLAAVGLALVAVAGRASIRGPT